MKTPLSISAFCGMLFSMATCSALLFSGRVQSQPVPTAGDSRHFFTTLYAQAPEIAKKVTITAAVCGLPVTPETAMKLMSNEEFTRLGNNSTALSEKCGALTATSRGNAESGSRPGAQVAPETMLMQALSGLALGGSPNSFAGGVSPRAASASSTPQAMATPTHPNGDKRDVDGINGWKGYVVGVATSDTRFAPVKIGMSNREVIDLIGSPSDQGIHQTGKAWIPYFSGAGKMESWMHYKGVGRLLLSQDGGGNALRFYIIGIEHDANESGYR
jgi:hypothetical protein